MMEAENSLFQGQTAAIIRVRNMIEVSTDQYEGGGMLNCNLAGCMTSLTFAARWNLNVNKQLQFLECPLEGNIQKKKEYSMIKEKRKSIN